MTRTIVSTKNAPFAIGPYSQGIVAGNLVFTAGQIAINPSTGEIEGNDIRAQTKQVLGNLKAILEAAGSNLSNVVKTTVYLKDMNDFTAMNEEYARFFAAQPPARSTVEVARLPKDVRVEIEAVGVVTK